MKNGLSRKQIPTLLGIGILIVSLIVGVLLVGQGGGVFAPRATPQTTPKKMKITNIKDNSFTVSFLTDEATTGFVKYGSDQANLKSQSSDDRDQLSGSVSPYTTHYITVRDALPNTMYFFTLGTGSNSKYDNNGAPFSVKTAQKVDTVPTAKTAYGTVSTVGGSPANGAIVYIDSDGIGEMSALVKESGSWAIPLSNARTTDGSQYATINDDTNLTLTIQGVDVATTTTQQVAMKNTQPVAAIVLGGAGNTAALAQDQTSSAAAAPVQNQANNTSSQSAVAAPATSSSSATTASTSSSSASVAYLPPSPQPSFTPTSTSSASSLTTTPAVQVVDTTTKKQETVTTTQPVITGQAAANVSVSIVIHSTNPISTQVQTDANGNFTVDLSTLQQNLAPGKHTITVSYTDPQTGKTITQTKTFTVKAAASPSPSPSPIADASVATQTPDNTDTTGPFGTGSPFPLPSESPSPSPRATKVASGSSLPKSGSVSTTLALLFGGSFFIVAGLWSFVSTRKATLENE